MAIRAADALVRSLVSFGTKRMYCVPGESYLALLDALYDNRQIETIVCRHESSAGFMALAEAKLTGNPAVFAVSRGPGASNGSIAVHMAEQDAVPLICLIGQVARHEKGRGAFQEVDYFKFYGDLCKSVFEPDAADQVAEIIAKAFSIAQSGTPGPVAIALPEDMLSDLTDAPIVQPILPPLAKINEQDQATLLRLLAASTRPLIIAGNRMRGASGEQALQAFADKYQIPVVCAWKAQDVFDNNSALYAGHIGFGAPERQKTMLAKADLIIALGTRLGDVTTFGYTLPQAPKPIQPLVHIYPDIAPLGRVFETRLGIVADPATFLATLPGENNPLPNTRYDWTNEIKSFVDRFMEFRSCQPRDGVDFGRIITKIASLAPDDALIVTDSGNFSTWVHRYWRLGAGNTLLGAIGGGMGFGVPGAIASSLVIPGRCIICVVGDGGIMMTGQEIATAVRYGANVKIVLSDNGCYGTIRTHQERRFPARISGTDLTNPDFTLWAQSFGIQAFTIEADDDIDHQLQQAIDFEGICLIHVHSSLQALSAFATLKES